MSTEIARLQPNPFEAYGELAATRNIVGRLLKFTKFGEYIAGVENEEIPTGTKLVPHMPSLLAGFIKWEANRPVAQVMGAIGDGFAPPKRNELGDTDQSKWERYDDNRPRDPWQFSNYLVFVNLDNDELFTFATSSRGGLNAIGELSKTYGKRIRQFSNELPLVELECGSYQHSNKSYGEIRFPVFKIVGWISSAQLAHLVGSPVNLAANDNNRPATITAANDNALAPPAETIATPPAAKNKAPVR